MTNESIFFFGQKKVAIHVTIAYGPHSSKVNYRKDSFFFLNKSDLYPFERLEFGRTSFVYTKISKAKIVGL